jgi:thiol-disulfide isomerase/thioredoxin
MEPTPEPERQRPDVSAIDANLGEKFNGEGPGYLPERNRNPPRDRRMVPGAAADPFPALPPTAGTPVPLCQLAGVRLVNLALKDQNGNVWEYRKDWRGAQGTGRLLLVEFWYSGCPRCRTAMPYLVELHRALNSHGLEVVGIALERGPINQQVAAVNNTRTSFGIPYATPLEDRNNEIVGARFNIRVFPTFVLLDQSGAIVFRREGLGDRDFLELVNEIRRRLSTPLTPNK